MQYETWSNIRGFVSLYTGNGKFSKNKSFVAIDHRETVYADIETL
jgi:hypothetical protein